MIPDSLVIITYCYVSDTATILITEYLRLALELEGLVSEEERIERFRESMMQGKQI